jgi:hypothetical protein
MEAVATNGPPVRLLNDAYVRENAALSAALRRLRLENPNPHTDLSSWCSHYTAHLPTWDARRAFLEELFRPVSDELLAWASDRPALRSVSESPTGWPDIDVKLAKLRADFSKARTTDEFRAIGLLCTSILEALGRLVFDPTRDLQPGSITPKLNDAKARIDAFILTAARGRRFENVRAIIRPSLAQAHAVKHSHTTDRLHACIAATATVAVVEIVRELVDDLEHRTHELVA